PLENPAPEVQDPLETDGSQKIRSLCASSTHLALHDQLFVGVEFRVATRNFAERDQLRARNAVDLPLVRFADVDDPKLLASVETLLELDGADFKRIARVHRGCLRCGRTKAAELLVVDELLDGRMGAAHRAVWILPEFQLTEVHAQRVVNQ